MRATYRPFMKNHLLVKVKWKTFVCHSIKFALQWKLLINHRLDRTWISFQTNQLINNKNDCVLCEKIMQLIKKCILLSFNGISRILSINIFRLIRLNIIHVAVQTLFGFQHSFSCLPKGFENCVYTAEQSICFRSSVIFFICNCFTCKFSFECFRLVEKAHFEVDFARRYGFKSKTVY